jgi:hypothetical protein
MCIEILLYGKCSRSWKFYSFVQAHLAAFCHTTHAFQAFEVLPMLSESQKNLDIRWNQVILVLSFCQGDKATQAAD